MPGCRSAVGGVGVLALCLVLGPMSGASAQLVPSADPQILDGETTSTTSTSSSTTTSTTMRPAADTPISATKLVIVQDRGGTTQRHHVVSKDPGIGRTTPCQLHSELVIDVRGVGRIAKPLQEDWWRQRSFYDPNKGCIYDDRAVTRDGLPTLIKLVQGKRLSIEVAGVPAGMTPLDGEQHPILYTLQHGGHRYCLTFGEAGRKRKKRKLSVGRTSAASCTLE